MKIKFKKINISNCNRSSSLYTKDSSSTNKNFNNEIDDLLLSQRKKNYYSLRIYNNSNNKNIKKTLFKQYN